VEGDVANRRSRIIPGQGVDYYPFFKGVIGPQSFDNNHAFASAIKQPGLNYYGAAFVAKAYPVPVCDQQRIRISGMNLNIRLTLFFARAIGLVDLLGC